MSETTAPTTTQTTTNKKKRKRENKLHKLKLSKVELHEKEVNEKYSKLVYQSTKILKKAIKTCKTFECQKIVRKIKASKTTSTTTTTTTTSTTETADLSNENEEKDNHASTSRLGTSSHEHSDCIHNDINTKVERRIKSLEEKLNNMKNLDLDKVVNLCFSRLGLDSLKPIDLQNMMEADGNTTTTTTTSSNNNNKVTDEESNDNGITMKKLNNNQCSKDFIESTGILQQKKLVQAMESVNESMLEYNQWLVRREEWLYGFSSSSKSQKQKQKGKSMSSRVAGGGSGSGNGTGSTIDVSGHEGDSGLFINSLAGYDNDYIGDEEGENQYEYDDDDDNDERQEYEMYHDFDPKKKRKKNRVGQRVRKAQALALEAKKHGTDVQDDIKSWWELKPKNKQKKELKQELASGLDVSKKVNTAEIVQMGSSWKEEGKAHPSWAARQVQKVNIGKIEFKGKKTTFD